MTAALAPLLAATATAFTVLLFARAAFHKLSDVSAFAGIVADYRIVPERLAQTAAALLAGAEFAVIVLLLVPGLRPFGALLAAGLLALYGAAILVNLRRGRDSVDCGCGGPPQPLSAALVLRNAALAAFALAAAAAGDVRLSVGEGVCAVSSAFALFAALIAVEQILANAGHPAMREAMRARRAFGRRAFGRTRP